MPKVEPKPDLIVLASRLVAACPTPLTTMPLRARPRVHDRSPVFGGAVDCNTHDAACLGIEGRRARKWVRREETGGMQEEGGGKRNKEEGGGKRRRRDAGEESPQRDEHRRARRLTTPPDSSPRRAPPRMSPAPASRSAGGGGSQSDCRLYPVPVCLSVCLQRFMRPRICFASPAFLHAGHSGPTHAKGGRLATAKPSALPHLQRLQRHVRRVPVQRDRPTGAA